MSSVKSEYSPAAWERHKERERARNRESLKRCSRCGEEKPRAEFARDTKQRLSVQAWCKLCTRVYQTEWRARRDPVLLAERARALHLQRKFGITVEEYEERLKGQGGVCAICGSAEPRTPGNRSFVVDHDHRTGVVRGLLCGSCNRGVGYLGDDVKRVRAALRYLERG